MPRSLLAALPLAVLASAGPVAMAGPLDGDGVVLNRVRTLQGRVSGLRSLAFRHDVPLAVHSEDRVRADTLAELTDPEVMEDFRTTKQAMVLFRIAEPSLDLEDLWTDIMGESLGGYYDPDHLELVLVSRDGAFDPHLPPDSEAGMTAAHELVHALQDQHFDLWELSNREWESDDADAAVSALVEGDASYTMVQFALGDAAQMLADVPLADLGLEPGDGTEAAGALGQAPRVLRDNLMFPYEHGVAFVHALQRLGGNQAIDTAFARPPLSTEQILHPDKYLSDTPDWPQHLTLPDLAPALGAGWSEIDANTIGEFGLRALLGQHLGHLPRSLRDGAAAGWDGDRYAAYAHQDGRTAGLWSTTWDSEDEAAEFARVATLWMATAAGPLARAGEDDGDASGALRTRVTDTRHWEVRRQGTDVHLLLDVPHAAVAPIRGLLPRITRETFDRLDVVAPIKDEPRCTADPDQERCRQAAAIKEAAEAREAGGAAP